MSSDLFHSDHPAAVMSLEDVPSALESDPFSPLPDVSLDTIFPQQPIPTPITPTSQILIPKPEFQAPPNFSSAYIVGDVSSVAGHGVSQLQRSFSCGTHFYQNPWFCFPPSYVGSPAFLGSDQFRRTHGAGDIQGGSVSRFILVNEAKIRTERCSAEERKVKIEKYRAKRSRRNIKKTIKYACRKTLADSRPRVRGRFVSNDEVRGMPGSAAHTNRDDALVEKVDG